MDENGFNPEAFLTKDTFTIPVELDDRDSEGKEQKRTVLITFQFGKEQEGVFTRQRKGLVNYYESALSRIASIGPCECEHDTAECCAKVGKDCARCIAADALANKNKEDSSVANQLSEVVRSIKGVSKPLTKEFWLSVPGKHQIAIGQAIAQDVFPSMPTSGD